MDTTGSDSILTIADLQAAASRAMPPMVRGTYSSRLETFLFMDVVR